MGSPFREFFWKWEGQFWRCLRLFGPYVRDIWEVFGTAVRTFKGLKLSLLDLRKVYSNLYSITKHCLKLPRNILFPE